MHLCGHAYVIVPYVVLKRQPCWKASPFRLPARRMWWCLGPNLPPGKVGSRGGHLTARDALVAAPFVLSVLCYKLGIRKGLHSARGLALSARVCVGGDGSSLRAFFSVERFTGKEPMCVPGLVLP